jgi:outer membrane protein assembly factor BamB
MYSQPLIVNGIMYYTNTVNQLTAVKLRNGSLKWKVDSENDEVDFSPVIYKDQIIWAGGSSCHHIYFIDPATGKITRKHYSENEIIAPLTTDGNYVYYLTTKELIAF